MPEYLIVVQRDVGAKSYFFDDGVGMPEFTEMLRDFHHPYEIYKYSEGYGYQRTARWPAQI